MSRSLGHAQRSSCPSFSFCCGYIQARCHTIHTLRLIAVPSPSPFTISPCPPPFLSLRTLPTRSRPLTSNLNRPGTFTGEGGREGGGITNPSLNTPPRPSFCLAFLASTFQTSRPVHNEPGQARPNLTRAPCSLHIRHFFFPCLRGYPEHLNPLNQLGSLHLNPSSQTCILPYE
ncbi:uncharacterized protein LY79DRAFT_176534 [Colletotrichum navitas]|uniref:Uncharacterized protein n=1 Tax=Colletotrichum navitas TaxID=681940 RepID=A0AAD8V6S8_9PEZI|nr:uncharacterized protein LY79DRAFT_176534 [Colletotrichum navitas]KAK1593660.1 hypothetical protein LY79DRAFT_176534 [Colletotrichum navitas]